MNIAEMICAYEANEHPFEDSDDTPAQEFLRKTFPIPVVVMTGIIATGKTLDFINSIADADTTKDAADVLGRFLASNDFLQLQDFFQTLSMIDEAWSNCAIDESGKVWIENSIDAEAN
jgi:hypothetical protein